MPIVRFSISRVIYRFNIFNNIEKQYLNIYTKIDNLNI